jgi:hypothetical protein
MTKELNGEDFKILDNTLDLIKENYPELFI